MIKNQRFIGTCEDYTYDGLGIVKNDAFCVFVKDMVKGETGEIVVTAVRKGYAYGRLLNILKPSSERVEPYCHVSKPCGGCQLQHMSYAEQLRMKHDHVEQTIRHIGKCKCEVLPTLPCAKTTGYRNKAMMPVRMDKDGHLQIGFYRYNSHDIIPFENCMLQSEAANSLINSVRRILPDYSFARNVRHLMIRDFDKTGEMMLVLVTDTEKAEGIGKFAREIVKENPRVVSLIQNINSADTNVVLGKKEILVYGEPFIQDILCGLRINISAQSFYQVNRVQTEVLYAKALELADLKKSDTLLDLYCGAGTIGLTASNRVRKVIGVEIVPEAIENARENASMNDITNVEFICGDAKKVAAELSKEQKPDVIIVDPPRKGCDESTLDSIVKMGPEKLVYVSCNPSTLARDIKYLENYYTPSVIQPVDMFPHTAHVETVVLLWRKAEQADRHIVVNYETQGRHMKKN